MAKNTGKKLKLASGSIDLYSPVASGGKINLVPGILKGGTTVDLTGKVPPGVLEKGKKIDLYRI